MCFILKFGGLATHSIYSSNSIRIAGIEASMLPLHKCLDQFELKKIVFAINSTRNNNSAF